MLAFAGGVIAANWLNAAYGLVSIGFTLTATASTFAAGSTLLARTGSTTSPAAAPSWRVSRPGQCSAPRWPDPRSQSPRGGFSYRNWPTYWSTNAAPTRAATRDARLQRDRRAVDTIVFLTLAGFPVWSALPGQLWVKAWASAIPSPPC